MGSLKFHQYVLLAILSFLLGAQRNSCVDAFITSTSVYNNSARHTTEKTSKRIASTGSQLSMALEIPLITRRPSILKKGAWYEETSPIKQRTIYNDDFDYYDENGKFRFEAPFLGVKSAPIVFQSSSASAASLVVPERKRDKLKRAAKWTFQQIQRLRRI